MKINTALILCAGFGRRLNPITLKLPKPLIKIDDITLLDNTLNLIESLGIQKIKINTFYLQDQIINFISNHHLKKKIEIIKDGNEILNTGGGILNLIKSSNEKDFIVFNPDTVWKKKYLDTINKMDEFYYKKKIKNLLMVVKKTKSYDERIKGDFELDENKLFKYNNNNYIYTGCQIINKNLFGEIKNSSFPISDIWDQLLESKLLYGYESYENFTHLTDLEIYKRLSKNN